MDRDSAEAAHAEVQRQAEIIGRVTDGVVVASANDGRIVYCNTAFETMFGYAQGELLGHSVARLNAPQRQTPEAIAATIMDTLGESGRWDGELLNLRKDGSTFWTFSTITCHDLPGWGAVWLGIQRDVSAQRLAEWELRLREGYLRAIFDNFPFLVWIKDQYGRFVLANQALTDATGAREPQQLAGTTDSDIWPPAIAERLQADERDVLTGGQARTIEYAFDAGGRSQWWEVTRSPIHFEGGTIGTVGFARDISDRRGAEQTVRERQVWLQAILEQLPVGVAVMDSQGRFLLSNALMRSYTAGERMPSHSSDQISRWETCASDGRPIPPDEWPGARALRGDATPQAVEFIYRAENDTTRSLLVSAVPFRGSGDEIAGAVAVLQDITERRASEAALRESEQRFEALVMASSDVVYRMNSDWTEMQSLDGRNFIPDTTTPSRDWLHRYIAPDDRAEVLWHIRTAVESRGMFNLEHRVRRGDAGVVWVHSRAVPILDDNRSVRAWIGMASDVTGRKEAEHALRASEELLRSIAENSHDEILFLDRSHHVEFVNPAALECMRGMLDDPGLQLSSLIGHTPWDILGDNEMTRGFRELDEQVMASGQTSSVEDVVGFGEQLRSRLTFRTPVRDANGDIVGVVAIARDITARKRQEAARLEEVAQQRDALVREVHHRIKNHLQGVLGLIRLQIGKEPALAVPLAEVMSQVRAIAGVYGLGDQSSGCGVDLGRIVDLVVQGAGTPAQLTFQSHLAGAVLLSEPDAVPIALIINELVANGLKHVERTNPMRPVRVALRRDGNTVRIDIHNGPAWLPPDFDFENRGGIGTGLQLLATLLPNRGARLRWVQDGDEVHAELALQDPVVTEGRVDTGADRR